MYSNDFQTLTINFFFFDKREHFIKYTENSEYNQCFLLLRTNNSMQFPFELYVLVLLEMKE